MPCAMSTPANLGSVLYRVFTSRSQQIADSTISLQRGLLPALPDYIQQYRHQFSTSLPRWKSEIADLHRPRDFGILKYGEYVQIAEGKNTSAPKLVKQLLKDLGRADQTLIAVSLPETGKEGGRKYPICKIVDRATFLNNLKRAASSAKAAAAGATNLNSAPKRKELEVNWAIEPHDLGHRIKQLQDFLRKGLSVEVTFSTKRKKGHKPKPVSQEKAKETVQMVKDAVEEVPGVREFKPMNGEVLGTLRMFFEGQAPSKS